MIAALEVPVTADQAGLPSTGRPGPVDYAAASKAANTWRAYRDRDELHRLRSQLVAVRAVVSVREPDYHASCETAVNTLRARLSVPVDRPGRVEAGYVVALDGQLRQVLSVLEGGDRDGRTARRTPYSS